LNSARIPADEVLINGRRYRVPEKVILLDFWNKLRKDAGQKDRSVYNCSYAKYLSAIFRDLYSALSSPLTSLSSLDDVDERVSEENRQSIKADDLKVAQASVSFSLNRFMLHLPQMLLGLRVSKRNAMLSNSNGVKYRQMVDDAVQTGPEQSTSNLGRATRATKKVKSSNFRRVSELIIRFSERPCM